MKIRLLLLLIAVPLLSFCQKQGNIWHFGMQCGIDFSTGEPINIPGGQTGEDVTVGDVQEGTSCISDSAGNLLFYTGGKTIWNKNHQQMFNGANIFGGTSSTQSSLIIPLPGSNSIYYVFTSDEFQGYDDHPPQKGYRYSIVDMCLNDSLGDVIPEQKNILLLDSSTEKITACEDFSGNGYWVMGHKMFSDEFVAWHLTSAGISETVTTKIGTIHGWHPVSLNWQSAIAQGQMKFNPQGTKLAVAISNITPGILDIFDFNNTTGVVSNFCSKTFDNDTTWGDRIYGLEFSPDGFKLFFSLNDGYPVFEQRLYQLNLNDDCNSIFESRQIIYQTLGSATSKGMQLAPNGKIYWVGNTYYDLSCINFPNLIGTAVGFDSSAISLNGFNSYSLPNFIAGYKYHNQLACTEYVPVEPPITELKIPNIFSPNADNINDTFIIENLPTDATVHIYNRWGALVAEWNKPDGSWDGRTKGGSQVSAGVYYYIVTQPDGERKKGFVEVIR